jgi:hypothetical protein
VLTYQRAGLWPVAKIRSQSRSRIAGRQRWHRANCPSDNLDSSFRSAKAKKMFQSGHITSHVFERSAGTQLDEISVFSQPWFVDAVYREEHRTATAFNKAGKPICAFPYGQRTVMGFCSEVTSLDRWRRLSSFIFLDKYTSNEEKRDAIADIIKQLPRSMAYCQFILDDDSGISRDAFSDAGFECIKMPKYIRRPSKQNYKGVYAYAQAKDNVMKTISKDARNRYQATREQVRIENISASDLCKFYESNLVGKGEESYSPLGIAETLIKNGIRRRNALTLAARDKDGIEAAAVFMFDSKTIYAWLTTRKHRPQSEKFSRAERHKKFCTDILVIEAMIFAEMRGLIYDAEIIPVERNGVPKSPHRIFVNEKILHLAKEDSRFLFERKGHCYHGATPAFYKLRKVAKRARGIIERRAILGSSSQAERFIETNLARTTQTT